MKITFSSTTENTQMSVGIIEGKNTLLFDIYETNEMQDAKIFEVDLEDFKKSFDLYYEYITKDPNLNAG